MPFQPGQSGNRNGRPKGARGKVRTEAKELLANLIHKELEGLPNRLIELATKERVEVLLRFILYLLPKMKHLDLTGLLPTSDPGTMILPDGTTIEI